MAEKSAISGFWRGVRGGLPFVLVVTPFAVLFGVVGTEAGLDISQVMGFSVLVIAGASQFTALQMMSENAPTVIILATAMVVNLRMAMYAAALAPHFGEASFRQRLMLGYFNFDQSFALGQAEFDRDPSQPLDRKIAYFVGVAVPLLPVWVGGTWAGAIAGTAIPPEYALDFAVPITFLALIAPALRTLAHMATALTSIIVALLLAWMPPGTGLILAAVAAMAVGARVELWQEARRR